MKPLHKTVEDGSSDEPDLSSPMPVVAIGLLIVAIAVLVVWGIVALASAGDAAVST